jgi:hypothetical protein
VSLSVLLAAAANFGGGTSPALATPVPATLFHAGTNGIVPDNVTGTYAGPIEDSVNGAAAISLQLVEYQAPDVQGSGTLVTGVGTSAVSVVGTITKNVFSGSLTVAATNCVYELKLGVKGKKLSGTYSPTGSCSNSGTVTVTYVNPEFNTSGTYNGTFYDETDGIQATISKLKLVQTGSEPTYDLAGTFTEAVGGQKASGSLSGTLSDSVATVSITIPGSACGPFDATLVNYGNLYFYGFYSATNCTQIGYIVVKK